MSKKLNVYIIGGGLPVDLAEVMPLRCITGSCLDLPQVSGQERDQKNPLYISLYFLWLLIYEAFQQLISNDVYVESKTQEIVISKVIEKALNAWLLMKFTVL